MKKHLIALSALALFTVAANAQTKTIPGAADQQHSSYMHHKNFGEGMHKHHGNHMMMKKLNLTEAQKQQAKEINADFKNQVSNLEKSDKITLKDYREKKANLEQERKSKFMAILTQDQKNKIASARKHRGEKMHEMTEKRMDKMKTDLNLTDVQVAKLKEQRSVSMSQAKTIRENSSLTHDQKKEQLMSLMKSNKENMKNILTADQLKKREEMRKDRIDDMKNKRSNKDS